MSSRTSTAHRLLPYLPDRLTNLHVSSLRRENVTFTRLPASAGAYRSAFRDLDAFGELLRLQPKRFVGVAEGDSWFDYLPAYLDWDLGHDDLLGELNKHNDLHVFSVAQAGDTLENMVYGPGGTGAQLKETLRAIRLHDARFLLFSGGGNDIAGPELEQYLYPLSVAPDPSLPVRKDMAEQILGKRFTELFHHMIDEARKTSPKIAIFLHGYDYGIPDGRGVVNLPLGFHFIGPWLEPAFTNRGIRDLKVRRSVIRYLIDRLNRTVGEVAAKRAGDGVHYLDLRGVLLNDARNYKKDWANELHATGRGWRKLADRFEAALLGVLGP
ncbi:MAG: hypothetical protein HYZ53_08260 [Planctomycetes bacterium]|nr:hypothetical protein [Planctomycetota bacterium]